MKNVYKLWIAFIVLALCAGSLQAAPVDTTMAKQLAGYFYLQKLGPSRSSDAGAIRATARIAQRAVTRSTLSDGLGGVVDCYYVINFDNGFVILAADDRVVPVLAYSTAGIFDTTNVPPAVAEWLEGYRRDIAQFLSSATDAGSNEAVRQDISGQWYNLRHNIPAPQRAAVAQLLQTTWSQGGNSYNAMCPDSAGVHALTGCVATAFAQVLRYWEYPDRGLGSHSYNHSKFGTLTADFGNTHYDYSEMPNEIHTYSSTAAQINAVATLMYHCGVSVDMNYGFSASSAATSQIVQALKNYFAYPSEPTYVNKTSYTDAEWIALLKNELNHQRPVLYSGRGSEGHAFILDGYDNSNLFHVNWGWGGSSDGYYQIGALSPGNYSFNLNNGAIIGVDAGIPMLFCPRQSAMLSSTIGGQSDIDFVDIRGIKLLDPITVTTSGDFTIGVSPSSLGTTATLPANGGILYVQYTPSVTDPQVVEGQLFLSSGIYHDTVSVFGQVYQTVCLPPTNLNADVTSTDVNLSWTAPAQNNQETTILSWDSTTNRNFPYGTNMTYCMLQRFAASDITQLTQHYVESISFIPRAGVTSYRVVVYQGGTCSGNNTSLGEQLVNQEVPVSTLTLNEWNSVRITNPVIIDNTQDLWFGIFATVGSTSSSLFNVGSAPYVADKGGIWGCYSGEYVENADFLLRQMTYFTNYFGSDNYERNLLLKATVEKIVGNVERYDIYHDNVLVGSTTGTSYTDNHVLTQPGRYTVDAVWNNSCSSGVSTYSFPSIPCLPTVTTATAVQTSGTTGSCGGEIIHNGNVDIITHGVCWSTNPNPTLNDAHTTDSSATNIFTNEMTGLIPGQTYYVRAYATNSQGTSYGDVVALSLYFIVPQTGTEEYTPSNSKSVVYDHGGPDENYSKNCNGTLILNTGNPNQTFEITGNYKISSYHWSSGDYLDNLYIYDGSGTTGTLLGQFYGYGSFTPPITSTQSTITIRFTSANSSYSDNIYQGFHLEVKKVGMGSVPTITTYEVSSITTTTAECGGGVLNDGGNDVTARGVCWSLSPNPTVADAHTTNGAGLGAFTSAMTGLTPNTTYYVRAYATNSVGTAYGNEMSFTTDGPFICGISTVKDYDGNRYNTVKIGDQCWMKENLRTTHYADGTEIPLSNTTLLDADNPYRFNANWDPDRVPQFGYLYNWKAVSRNSNASSTNPSGVRGICPSGWHVPSANEFWQLTNYLSSHAEYICGTNTLNTAKSLAATTAWTSSTGTCAIGNNVSLNNATGFSALPAGMLKSGGMYDFGYGAYFWTTTWYDNSSRECFRLLNTYNTSTSTNYAKTNAMSVRCIKDSVVSEDFGEACPGVPSVSDVDGNIYNTVKIGDQCWMKENLRTTRYADGTEIPLSNTTTLNDTLPYRFNANWDPDRVPQFGYLYNWKAVMHNSHASYTNPSGVQGICPSGWHVPSENEFWQLTKYLSNHAEYLCNNNTSNIAKSLAARSAWVKNTNSCAVGNDLSANNAAGFTALPAGILKSGGMYDFGHGAYFWTTTWYDNSSRECFRLLNTYNTSTITNYAKTNAMSVRCIKDSVVSEDFGEACPGVPSVSDVDGNIYNTVKIGDQCWMKENLRTTRYADGTEIPLSNTTTLNDTLPYRFNANWDPDRVPQFGYLYNWKAVMRNSTASATNPSGVQGVCPTGWHVPSENEFSQLTNYLSSHVEYRCNNNTSNIAKSLAARSAWVKNTNSCAVGNDLSANNATGFTALPAGVLKSGGMYDFGHGAFFWTTTWYDNSSRECFRLLNTYNTSTITNYAKTNAMSVRCVQAVLTFPPTITTDTVSDIGTTSVSCGGNVADDGNATVTARGVCWSTSPYPTVNGSHTTDGSGLGAFTSSITGLTPNTKYYVRAYAINSAGTAYGEQRVFTTECNTVSASISGLTSICQGLTTTLTASGGNSYQWSNASDEGSISVSTSGIYSVTVYNQYGCSATASTTVTVNPLPGINISGNTTICQEENTVLTADGANNYVWICNGSAIGTSASVTVSPTATTEYSVSGTNNYGCSAITSITITVNPQPTVTLSGNTTISLGNNTTLTASGANSYVWSNGGSSASITVSPTVTTIYTVTGTNSYGCINTASITVTVNAILPTVTTSNVSSIGMSSATCGGNVTSDGGAAITARGICWSTSQNPTVNGNHASNGTGTGSFTSYMTELAPNTTYYVRAYATNSVGTTYGEQKTFTTACNTVNVTIAGNTTIGYGESTTLTASGANNYVWKNGNTTVGNTATITVSLTSTTTYTVTGTNQYGCTGTASVTVTMNAILPTVTTSNVSSIAATTATSGGNVTSDGGAAITARGICWSTSQNPTVSGSHTTDGTGTGSFTSYMTELAPNTTYYVRAYATNSAGTTYGEQKTFTTACNTVNVTIAGNTTIGYGESTTLTASGANSYVWRDGNSEIGMNASITVSPTATTVYFVTGTNQYGCTGTASVTVTVNAILPTITTNNVSNIAATTATSGGNVTSDGGAAVTARGVCWSTSQNPTVNDSHTTNGAGTGSFTSSMTGFTPNTIYYVRAFATNGAGTAYGEQMSFTTGCNSVNVMITGTTTIPYGSTTTLTASGADSYVWKTGNTTVGNTATITVSPTSTTTYTVTGTNQYGCTGTASVTVIMNAILPTVTTSNVSSIAATTATSGGNVTSDGGAAITARGICWSTSQNPTVSDSHTINGTGTGGFTSVMTGLTPNTTYYVRAYATNSAGTTYGEQQIFTTSCNTVTVSVTGTTTISYGGSTNLTASGANNYVWKNGNTTVGNTASITVNPTATTTYSVMGTNQYGCTGTASVTVTVNAILPTVTTNNVSNIATTTATSGGNITSDGGSAITARGICWSTSQSPTVNNSHTTNGSGTGVFTSAMTDLTPNTTYYVRSYATNSAGTAYGVQKTFTTLCNTVNITVTGTTTINFGEITTLTASGANNYVWKNGNTTVGNTVSVTVSPTATTTYSVTGTDLYGCTGTTSVTVVVNTLLPTVTTNMVSNIAATMATSGGNVTSDGGSGVTARGVCWSTSQNPTVSDSHTINGTGTGAFTSVMTGLTPNTTYYVRAFATNSAGTMYGEQQTFTTSCNTVTVSVTGTTTISYGGSTNLTASGANNYVWKNGNTTVGNTASITVNPTATTTYSVTGTNQYGCTGTANVTVTVNAILPTVTTNNVSNIAASTATSGGNVTSDGGAAVTARGVCWSTSQNPTVNDSHTTNGTGTGSFTSSMTGLTPNTIYYVRAFATNSAGTAYGEQMSFTTGCNTVNVMITGTTTIPYGSSTTLTASGAISYVWASGNTTVGTNAAITVAPMATTTYSVTGTNQYGCTGTSSGTVNINAIYPTVTTSNISNISVTNATSGGNVTSDGGATVIARGICWSTSSSPTVSGDHTSDGVGTGSFTSALTNLTPNTTYYVRAYATNAVGTSYGQQRTFTTGCNTVTVGISGETTFCQGYSTALTAAGDGSYLWSTGDTGNVVVVTTGGLYTVTATNQYGCTGTASTMVTVNTPVNNATSMTVCESYTWTSGNGQTYTTSGDYTYAHLDANGCTQVDTLHLIVSHGTHNVETETACESYTWHGQAYSQSGTYTHAYTSPEGCASVDTLHLTVLHGTHNVETETACESYTWHGQAYTGSGTYMYAYTNAEGCASVDTLYLTVNHGTHNVETETACESYTWHGQAYTGSGTYTYAYTNAEGCASVDTLHLTVNHGTHNVETETACESYTWHGQTYVTSGTYTYAYTNVDGCASEDTLHLSLVMAPEMSAISGAQLVCRNQYETYHYSVDNPNYQYRWYKNNMLVAENESNLTLHEQYAGMVYLTMQVTDDQQICQADTTLAVQVSDNVAPDLAEIRRKSSSNILVCEEVSSPYGLVHYRWGYTDRGTGAEATLGGDINYCLYDFGIDTFAYDYWVETWIDYGDASCANRSHFGSSYLSGTEDFDGDVLEAYISHGRVYLFVNTSEPGTVTASLYNANGKLLITRNYGYTDMVTDAFAADFANGVYVLHVTVDGRHHSFKLIKL